MLRWLARAAEYLSFWLVLIFAVGVMTLCLLMIQRTGAIHP